jgi:hypothetical protein
MPLFVCLLACLRWQVLQKEILATTQAILGEPIVGNSASDSCQSQKVGAGDDADDADIAEWLKSSIYPAMAITFDARVEMAAMQAATVAAKDAHNDSRTALGIFGTSHKPSATMKVVSLDCSKGKRTSLVFLEIQFDPGGFKVHKKQTNKCNVATTLGPSVLSTVWRQT